MIAGAWKSFGASVIGPGHVATGKPNQDAWAAFHHPWGDGVVVSDGLGSKPYSDWGSVAACRAVEVAAVSLRADSEVASFLPAIRDEWLAAIAPLSARDSAATCVFAIATPTGRLHLGLLGDGAVAAVLQDGTVHALTDDKSGGFSNTTRALTPTVDASSWQTLTLEANDCVAVMLCTDGVSDDLEDLSGFVRGFSSAFAALPTAAAARHAGEMLWDWPVPKHSDDKTLACLLREASADG